jgi:metallo-beta-lactamase family protein
MTIQFFGAARTTTGSMHLVEVNGLKILLDCGLFQGRRKEAFERNRKLPIDPAQLDYVILSHAHIDHSGNLPTLARHGFRGTVICTPATRDLCDVMLRDSAHLQQMDVEHVNKRRAAQEKTLFEPLYLMEHVDQIMAQFQSEPLKRQIDLGSGVSVLLHEAGHILGSAIVQLDAKQADGTRRRLVFSGDLGQPDQPILRPYDTVSDVDALLIESTYADRVHPPKADVIGRLKGFIDDIHQQRSKLIIPAFSVGRTQQILFYLNELVESRRIPRTPIIVDSPLSLKATKIYAAHRECYGEEASRMLRAGDDFLRFPGLSFTQSTDESKALNDQPGPMVIISASGMCEGGRILHHLRNTVGDPRNIILIVGFQAENTLGRRLVDYVSPLRILGDEFDLKARVHTINALSAHADKDALNAWLGAITPPVTHAFAIHGEEPQVNAMGDLLRAHGAKNVHVPSPGERFTV